MPCVSAILGIIMKITVIAHNVRSTYNVGSILRTADGFGVDKIYLTGYTPYPEQPGDQRLPHLQSKITAQIHKTALGAEITVPTEYSPDIVHAIQDLKNQGYQIIALEQSVKSTPLADFKCTGDLALLLGEEVHGIEPQFLEMCDNVVEIPMRGQKESFNVSVAAGIALYELSKNRN